MRYSGLLSLSIFFPWRNAVLTSADFKCHSIEVNTNKVDWIPILLQCGESVWKSFDMTHRVKYMFDYYPLLQYRGLGFSKFQILQFLYQTYFVLFHQDICVSTQAFIQALLSTAVFPQRFRFFTVCLVQWLSGVAPC